jgi:tRNA G18 (ribose-2'-O)-methylase SpoU
MENVQYNLIVAEDKKREFAVLDPFKDMSVEELAAIQMESAFPFSVCLLNVTGELNVGSIIRTSCTMGAQEVILFGRRWYDKRSAVNAWAYQKITRVEGLLDDGLSIDCEVFWNFIEEGNYNPIFVETGGTPLQDFNWRNYFPREKFCGLRPLLVLGTERSGIPEELLKGERVVSIPMVGVLRSMNVSNAAAMVMWDLKTKMGWI